MAKGKCKSCGSSELEVDPSRGDTVCTSCGTVLEDSIIVSEVQFEENNRGMSSAIGQFVSSESAGGCRGFGNSFHGGVVRESRDITLANAKRAIVNLSQSLRLNQHCIDTSFNFYKMALSRHLTRGRRHSHIIAACVYITCRIETTPHLLIDLSDVLQICAFELGRTYIKLSQALCINVPSIDPCLYVLRFANKLEFGEKTHEVAMTALRLVQRMKRDSMHYGRRPSGICGAALLMAARLHNFNRTVGDIVKVVQVHETTLRKRLVEFGETPSSSLTLNEFMTVDLEEEQDPPCYKAARAKDRERLKQFEESRENAEELNQLQFEIEKHIFESKRKKHQLGELPSSVSEDDSIREIVAKSTFDILDDIEEEDRLRDLSENGGLGPNLLTMGLEKTQKDETELNSTGLPQAALQYISPEGDLILDDLDDDELDTYLMEETEAERKGSLWHKLNADYLKAKQEKEERLKRELEEGKTTQDKKKRKVSNKKKSSQMANSAGEAIEKMLQEKKISTKINYDVLKSLKVLKSEMESSSKVESLKAEAVTKGDEVVREEVLSALDKPTGQRQRRDRPSTVSDSPRSSSVVKSPISKKPAAAKEPATSESTTPVVKTAQQQQQQPPPPPSPVIDLEEIDEDEDEPGNEGEGVLSLAQMLSQHNREDGDGDYYDDYDEDDY